MQRIRFGDIRSDWYDANTLLPRLVAKALLSREPLCLEGFPAQWIPICVHFGIACEDPRPPSRYMPLVSDQSAEHLLQVSKNAKAAGASRPLVESVAALDPVLADFLYIIDHRLSALGWREDATPVNLLNTWHSFSRPNVIDLQERMCHYRAPSSEFLMLPCSKKRPYNESRTHSRILYQLRKAGLAVDGASQVVVTALGVVPAAYWAEPLVMTYNAGAVDLWRVFQLLRSFFTQNPPTLVIDCLSFRPYSEMLNQLHDLRIIPTVTRPLVFRWRGFYAGLP